MTRVGASATRIIPARAGFTNPASTYHSQSQDHPRSRGVYTRRRPLCSSPNGSSPLARGLPLRLCTPHGRIGIIPARAGFTGRVLGGRLRRWDHPRSRGVYSRGRIRRSTWPGSSPLARGLRDNYPNARIIVGIIPARAGFTPPVVCGPRHTKDHPRSRGVYHRGRGSGYGLGGSSPLARGLPVIILRLPEGSRIIPARAGFTLIMSPFSLMAADHPRSRGVY